MALPTTTHPNGRGNPATDDIDRVIYDLRIRQHQSLRAVAEEVNLHHTTVRDRLRRILRDIEHPEVEQMRTEEGHRLDELQAQNQAIIETALTPIADIDGTLIFPSNSLEIAQRGLKEIHQITRTRDTLFGLARVNGQPPPDDDRLNSLFEAYLAGVRDTEAKADR